MAKREALFKSSSKSLFAILVYGLVVKYVPITVLCVLTGVNRERCKEANVNVQADSGTRDTEQDWSAQYTLKVSVTMYRNASVVLMSVLAASCPINSHNSQHKGCFLLSFLSYFQVYAVNDFCK